MTLSEFQKYELNLIIDFEESLTVILETCTWSVLSGALCYKPNNYITIGC